MPVGVLSIGCHTPDTVIDNQQISAWTGMPESWVTERTGVLQRRYATPGTTTSDLAVPAAGEALDALGPEVRGRLGALIVATSTPDVPQPSTAAILQHKLGLSTLPAFDINAVCSGFLYGLAVAEGLLSAGRHGEHVLLVGADMFSTIMDRSDRRTVSLFGDGAGAVVLGKVPEGYGLQSLNLVTDGEFHHYVGVEAGGTRTPLDAEARAAGKQYFRMDGRAVRDYALAVMDKLTAQTLDDTGLALEDIDRFVFHQANTRLLETFVSDAGIDPARVAYTAPRLGNTVAASVPLTLHATHRERPLRRGDRVLLASVGGGMTAGAALLVWY
ncbi:ketoacyl-ACP synthase III [Streptomyces sp. SBST2-5]|uniref:Ketoacyl-ACP synthase III n=1 Tax=Streptomyces composti TaxID=2720025 RepID=A0ABX1A985_9ACTN|nr:ketoacyl-ACP synthase III [Streptomyces composti]NJP51189.1 ketoacyl-ACP synthase III [Streptomyces composti]